IQKQRDNGQEKYNSFQDIIIIKKLTFNDKHRIGKTCDTTSETRRDNISLLLLLTIRRKNN
ncbi:hypothetical protein PP707_02570, partial [Acetobacter pasteurianus]|nr:hypothetical protein [Acetobacter pasteurianus]